MDSSKSSAEIMVPSEKKIKIYGQEFTVKPFSLKDVIFFSRDLMDGLLQIQKKHPDMKFEPQDAVQFIPALLDEAPRLVGLFARAIGKDGPWLEECHDLVGVSALFLAITEINDFGAIFSNFRAGWSKLQNQTIKASAAQ